VAKIAFHTSNNQSAGLFMRNIFISVCKTTKIVDKCIIFFKRDYFFPKNTKFSIYPIELQIFIVMPIRIQKLIFPQYV